jgi:hypothetical protein
VRRQVSSALSGGQIAVAVATKASSATPIAISTTAIDTRRPPSPPRRPPSPPTTAIAISVTAIDTSTTAIVTSTNAIATSTNVIAFDARSWIAYPRAKKKDIVGAIESIDARAVTW